MNAAVSLALFVSLVGTPPGPIARSIAREAACLATAPEIQPARSGWSRVEAIAAGSEVIVTVRGSAPVHKRFLAATESQLTVSAAERPLGDPAAVVETISSADVVEISTPARKPRHPVAFGALIGAASGLVFAVASYGPPQFHSCSSECYGGPLTALAAGIGAAGGAGVGGLVSANRRGSPHLIYRTP
jgi:hypothetical protein